MMDCDTSLTRRFVVSVQGFTETKTETLGKSQAEGRKPVNAPTYEILVVNQLLNACVFAASAWSASLDHSILSRKAVITCVLQRAGICCGIASVFCLRSVITVLFTCVVSVSRRADAEKVSLLAFYGGRESTKTR